MFGLHGRIRTYDNSLPRRGLYQTELRTDCLVEVLGNAPRGPSLQGTGATFCHPRCLVLMTGFEPALPGLKGRLPRPVSRHQHYMDSVLRMLHYSPLREAGIPYPNLYPLFGDLYGNRTRLHSRRQRDVLSRILTSLCLAATVGIEPTVSLRRRINSPLHYHSATSQLISNHIWWA